MSHPHEIMASMISAYAAIAEVSEKSNNALVHTIFTDYGLLVSDQLVSLLDEEKENE